MSTIATAPLLSLAEAATILRVSRATAYRLVHAGELPAHRIGGSLRVDTAELRAYIDSKLTGDSHAAPRRPSARPAGRGPGGPDAPATNTEAA